MVFFCRLRLSRVDVMVYGRVQTQFFFSSSFSLQNKIFVVALSLPKIFELIFLFVADDDRVDAVFQISVFRAHVSQVYTLKHRFWAHFNEFQMFLVAFGPISHSTKKTKNDAVFDIEIHQCFKNKLKD